MIAKGIPVSEDSPAMPKSNYRERFSPPPQSGHSIHLILLSEVQSI